MNFLYCFDSNYNTQAFVSVYSLLNSVNEKINIFIIHKSEKTHTFFPASIVNHKNLNNLEVYKFNKNNLKFYNLENAHVTEATFYRLFLLNYLPLDISKIVYLDADVYCLQDPITLIKKEFELMKKDDLEAGFSIEFKKNKNNLEVFKRLKLNGNSYFNAGVMIMDLNKSRKNKFTKNITSLLSDLNNEATYWDQDVLNKYFDNKFYELSENLNYKINFFDTDYTKLLMNNKEISIIHYSGKFKPWSIKGIAHSSAYIFQDIYFNLFKKKYYIFNSRKYHAFRDLVKIILTLNFKHIKYPVSFILMTVRYLLKSK
tara:strand:+ start:14638 stop:15582 length:945 start_codon:yes stop_codon:yes gene_type:complete